MAAQYRLDMAQADSLPAIARSRASEDAGARGSRHAADQGVIDLEDTYRRLAHGWTRGELATRYREADERGADRFRSEQDLIARPIGLLATATPRAASLSVAIHMLHALPAGARGTITEELVATIERNAAEALHRCNRALELDGAARAYKAEEWLPVIYDTAAPLLESADPSEDPPTVVQRTQEAISWLSRAIRELDNDEPDAATALAETIARLLAIWVFADMARDLDGDR
jgi:hypothetical protein